ncbi:DNA repair ATPase [Adhaeribacter terreus]|uniref:DNA repair ATPase n=1 Tax=Adhaeribacter terreus TaxID=529703 RepID=A0ABW0E9Q5_9BACT
MNTNSTAAETTTSNVQLESGTYEILRGRLQENSRELQQRMEQLNQERKHVFGAIETALLGTERITTENNCIPWDMVPVGSSFLFGYNVVIGLKSEIELADVFSVYGYADRTFHPKGLELINDTVFAEDFKKLYKYYKNTQFVKFAITGTNLFMVFRIGKGVNDIKTFKWVINGDSITYLDNRSDHEFVYPTQHDFSWKRPTREAHRKGKYPHVSIEDKVFVETVGGDLTIKIEDNTESGQGIYSEEVEDKDQTLDDSEIYYAIIGNIIILKIRPYRENKYRYIVYNSKMHTARRIDALEECCIMLPDNQGIIYAYGYYLQTGDFKQFENNLRDMIFEKRIASPNGEDFLYVFYNKEAGTYLLLSYNLISQKIENPIVCHGYAIFENGELCFFRADNEPKKNHAIQVWQTPYVSPDYTLPVTQESYVYKIGNKDIVRAMAESTELLTLLNKDDSYSNLYLDLIKRTTDILDGYHWLSKEEIFNLAQPLVAIRQTATAAVDEFEKVVSIRKNTEKQINLVLDKAEALVQSIKIQKAAEINTFVKYLAELRALRGEVISLKELRYADLEKVATCENKLAETTQEVSNNCVIFLLKQDALQPYEVRVKNLENGIELAQKVVEIDATEKEINAVSAELEMLIEVVSNLKIEDATQTTSIIDAISAIYSGFNQTKAALKRKKKALLSVEGKAEFSAQLKLISQGVINFLDLCDTPQKCEEYLARLMVQLEELEGKFPDFEEFVDQISVKREEIYNTFETKKVSLQEARNKRANSLQQSADRILKVVQSRVAKLTSVNEINGYFASDLMIEKVRNITEELLQLGDPVKADTIQSRLKTVREDAVRQLKDRQELFVNGTDILKLGDHHFTVNTQPLALSIVNKEGEMFFHLTGTNFFEKITDQEFLSYREVWEQTFVSENDTVYRGEYLAYKVLEAAKAKLEKNVAATDDFLDLTIEELYRLSLAELTDYVQKFMATRFNEGYVKGVHDHDAALILQAMVRLTKTADLLRFDANARACAALYWQAFAPANRKNDLNHQLKGVGAILQVFPNTHQFDAIKTDLEEELKTFISETSLCEGVDTTDAAAYLFYELTRGDHFVIDLEAATLYNAFLDFLRNNKVQATYEASVKALEQNPALQFALVQNWVKAFAGQSEQADKGDYVAEAAVLLFTHAYQPDRVISVSLREKLSGFRGSHSLIEEQNYQLHFNSYMNRLRHYEATVVPAFNRFSELKKQLTHQFEEELRLNEFKPRVLSSFVRNKLLDQVYLPLIGANLAKQIGTAGENKRTDLMGMLLLISPPGYGKTTIMEYLANRLGIIFMKINGPALGHQVTALDPAEAPNAAAREELEKLNLAFEMGDNVMIYLDDIQHCNPEFLQKFISLCDAQRKIEGVYKGKSKTYDFRGKKVCVVMAGNPYTETGEKFRIPDMLANRADIYNLGDIIGNTEAAFKLSYLENALTSNKVLANLASKSQQDVYALVKLTESGSQEGISFEGNHSPEELNEYTSVLKKLLRIRDIILRVNLEYIRSAAQAEEYRTEPPFKLQGSYRNMNKLTEKVMPIMNDEELQTLILSHYEGEAQTLTSGAEANMLKFRELNGMLSEVESQRWDAIKATYVKNLKRKGFGENNQVGQVLEQMEQISGGLMGIKDVLGRFSQQ